MRPKVEWAIDSEAMRGRGIIVFVNSNKLVKKISRQNIFSLVKARHLEFVNNIQVTFTSVLLRLQ